MQGGQDSVTGVPSTDLPSQGLLSKEGMTDFCARFLDYTRSYSQNDEGLARFEKDIIAWRDYARRSYDKMPKYQADYVARDILSYLKLGWYAALAKRSISVDSGERPRTAFFDDLLDSMGFERKIQIG